VGGVMKPKKKSSTPTSGGGKFKPTKKPPSVQEPKNTQSKDASATPVKSILKKPMQRKGRTMLSDAQGKGQLGE